MPIKLSPEVMNKLKVDLAIKHDEFKVSMLVNDDGVMHFFENQTKTIYNTEPYEKKDPLLLQYYKLPIKYELWEQYPKLAQKYKVGSHHKMDDIVFEVMEHDKNIANQDIIIVFKEAENIGIIGPNDSLMDGITGKDLYGHDWTPPLMKGVSLDHKLTITIPKEETVHIKLKERSERSKLFYELTHGVSLNE